MNSLKIFRNYTNPKVKKTGSRNSLKKGRSMDMKELYDKQLALSEGNDEISAHSFLSLCDLEISPKLQKACERGDASAIGVLLTGGCNVNSVNEYGNSPLHIACEYGHSDAVKILLEKGASPDLRNKDGYFPLHYACENGNVTVVRILLDRGVNVNAKSQSLNASSRGLVDGIMESHLNSIDSKVVIPDHQMLGYTPLHIASEHGHYAVVEILLERNAFMEAQTKDLYTPLHFACENGQLTTISQLLEKGANIEARSINHNMLTPVLYSLYLLSAQDGSTPLHFACANGQDQAVSLLLIQGANMDAANTIGYICLHRASENGHTSTVKMLLDKGVQVNARAKEGSTALHLASVSDKPSTVNLLIDRGADIEAATLDGRTALHIACARAMDGIVSVLIARGANLECRTQDDDTPLHQASAYGEASTVMILLDKKCSISARNKVGDTPLHTACRNGEVATVVLLLSRGADVNDRNHDGLTPLHIASFFGFKKLMEVLIVAGAPIDAVDKYGDPALHPKPSIFESAHPYPNNTKEYTPVEIPGASSYKIEFDSRTSTEPFDGDNGDYLVFYKNRSFKEIWGSGWYSGGFNGSKKNFPGVDGQPPLIISANRFIFHFFTEDGLSDWGYRLTVSPIFLREDVMNGWTPLMWASYNGKAEAIEALIEQGADLEASGWDGNTAISLAIQNFHEDAALLLVQAGALLHVPNKARLSPIKIAVQVEFHSFISLFFEVFEPFIDDTSEILKEGAVFVLQYVLSNTESFVDEFCRMLDRYSSRLLALANGVDNSGRRTKDVARPVYKQIIMERIYFFKIYELREGAAEHTSSTCIVKLAIDHSSKDVGQVALKFMNKKDDFLRELESRTKGGFEDAYVIRVIRAHDSDNDPDFKFEIERKGFQNYPYCIAMPAAERNLSTILTHEHIAGRDWHEMRIIGTEIVKALEHVHSKNYIHGDVMGLNIVRHGGRLKFVDWDASASYVSGHFSGAKVSSAFSPPELLALVPSGWVFQDASTGDGDKASRSFSLKAVFMKANSLFNTAIMSKTNSSLGRRGSRKTSTVGHFFGRKQSIEEVVVVRTFQTDVDGNPITENLPYKLVPAHVSHDMWALGVVLYHLFTGEPLFKANDEDNIDQENLWKLYEWSDEFKAECLCKVDNPLAKNLLSRLLSKDPSRRPDTGRVLAHPFFSGQKPARMIGDDPEFDVFISYRVSSDVLLAEALYNQLTELGLSVWWDKKRIEPGQKWEDCFIEGLMNSAVFVPLLSKDAIHHETNPRQNLLNLTEDSPIDNVVLEHRMALEFMDMGLIEAIYPVFIGETADTGEYQTREYARYKREKNPLPDIAVRAIEEKLREHLEGQGLGAPMTEKGTVKDVFTKINSFQGGYIEHNGGEAVSSIAQTIATTVNNCNSSSNADTEDETDILKTQLEHLRDELRMREKEISRLKSEKKLRNLNEDGFSKDDIMASGRTVNNPDVSNITGQQTEVERLNELIIQLNKELETLREGPLRQTDRDGALPSKIEELTASIATRDIEIEQLKTQIIKLKNDNLEEVELYKGQIRLITDSKDKEISNIRQKLNEMIEKRVDLNRLLREHAILLEGLHKLDYLLLSSNDNDSPSNQTTVIEVRKPSRNGNNISLFSPKYSSGIYPVDSDDYGLVNPIPKRSPTPPSTHRVNNTHIREFSQALTEERLQLSNYRRDYSIKIGWTMGMVNKNDSNESSAMTLDASPAGEIITDWVDSITIASQHTTRTVCVSGHPEKQGTLLSLDPLSLTLMWRGRDEVNDKRGDLWYSVKLEKDMQAGIVSGGAMTWIDIQISLRERMTINFIDYEQRDRWYHRIMDVIQIANNIALIQNEDVNYLESIQHNNEQLRSQLCTFQKKVKLLSRRISSPNSNDSIQI